MNTENLNTENPNSGGTSSVKPAVTKAKGPKKAIDPDAPKRANSAFILFSQVERENTKTANPNATNTDIYKLLGGQWREASAETKAKYESLYKASKSKADEEIAAYAQTDSFRAFATKTVAITSATAKPESAVAKNATPKKALHDPNAPKRASSAYILFSQAERASVKAAYPDATNTEIYQRLGEKWREASADTKATFESLYKVNKTKAEDEMAAYEQTDSFRAFATNAETVAPATKKAPTDPNAPKRASSAFIIFSQAERANVKEAHPEASNTDIYKRLGEKWNETTAETKAEYHALYKANKTKADEDRAAYAQTDASKAFSSKTGAAALSSALTGEPAPVATTDVKTTATKTTATKTVVSVVPAPAAVVETVVKVSDTGTPNVQVATPSDVLAATVAKGRKATTAQTKSRSLKVETAVRVV